MENKKIVSLAIMSVVMGAYIATASAEGVCERPGDPAAFSEIVRAEREALRSGDYRRWKSAVESSGQTEILGMINESNFARFSRAFALCENGDMAGAEAIIEELEGAGLAKSGIRKDLELSREDRESLELALVNGDYGAWKNLMEEAGNGGWGRYLTEENFNVAVRAYKIAKSGNRARAIGILDDGDVPRFLLAADGKEERGGGRLPAAMAAYENGDYAAWKSLMEERGGGKILEIVDADNFAEFARAKLLQCRGRAGEAKDILDGLGFPFAERKADRPGAGMSARQG